jgi:hypothetical protein
VNRWEIWNEENHPFFWFNVAGDSNRGPSARDYVALFSLARDSILAGNPQAEVAVGGLASFSGHVRPVSDPLGAGRAIQALPPHMFLREVLKLGVQPRAVGIHPYSAVPPGKSLPGEGAAVFPDLVVDSVATVLDAFALSSTTLWVTEWGVDAKPTMDQGAVNSWYEAGLNSLLCNRRVVFVTLHALADPDPQTHFGVLNDDGSDARDGVALRDFLSHWAGCASR